LASLPSSDPTGRGLAGKWYSVLSIYRVRCQSFGRRVRPWKNGCTPVTTEDLQSIQQHHVERLVATARMLIAGLLLLAISLDPAGSVGQGQVTSAFVAGYVAYALLLAVLAWRRHTLLTYLQFITHAFDLAVFLLLTILTHFTEASASIFFVAFGYSLACATLRWQWRGAFWTAVAILAAYSAVGAYATAASHHPALELIRSVMRIAYVIVVAVLLGYVGIYGQRLYSQMSMLAAWPHTAPREARMLVRNVLEHIAGTLSAPRVVMAWEEPEEPWLNLASWSRGELHWTREPPGTFEPLVVQPLAGTNFLCQDTRTPVPTVLYTASSNLQRWQGMPLHPNLQGRFAMDAVLSLNLPGEALEGRLFVADRPSMTADDLVLGGIVARKVAADLEQFYSFQQLQEVGITAERMRLARNLHDGLLQSLTGVSVQLEMVNRLLDKDLQAVRNYLLEIQGLIVDEQRDLRFFVQELNQTSLGLNGPDFSLVARLVELSARIERQWGLRVELNLEAPEIWIPKALVPEIYSMIREALSNAARHAQASTVRVDLGVDNTRVRIIVADNGRGFPFHGQYDLAALTTMNLGPTTLKERIMSLGGYLAIDSTEAGACLHISLPLTQSGAQETNSSGGELPTRV
jgi:signal transduction histidine kinase